ncbi:MAG: hypothetical protein DCC50_14835 [Acidobacteria bacterium]|nr:MAG: hypothetical protein DCC50_14835 [Acidobacteriota bacterium]
MADTARRVAVGAGADADRLAAAELATVVRLACVYAFRPTWRDPVLGWAERRWAERRWGTLTGRGMPGTDD